MAVTKLQEARPVTKAIYSNIKELVEEHQYFFETLWSRAVPAEQRIAEIEGSSTAERTEIVYGEENSLNALTQAMDRTKKEALACSSSIVPVFCMTVEPAKQRIIAARQEE
jgi:hypothetical protein